jgi:nitrogen fixation NifU-like protein
MVEVYSAQLLDHFQNPRNAGEILQPDAAAEIENPVCGDVLLLTVRVVDGRIAEARFKARGCVPAMACGSALTELIVGKMPRQVRLLRREEVIEAVGGIPHASMHAAQLAIDALSAVLLQIGPDVQ